MSDLVGVSVLIVAVVSILALGVLLVFAPLMLYGIFARLGEIRDLARYLAEQVHEARKPHPGDPALRI